MDVSSVYRRQDVMREISRRIGYQGRYVWLIPATNVTINASNLSGASRLRFRLLDITQEPYTFHRFSPREGKQVKLDPNTALVALPTMRGRRRDLLVFLCPMRARAHAWACANGRRPSPEEIAVLRQEDDAFDRSTMTVAHAVCVYRGLVDPRGRLSPSGTAALDKGGPRPGQ